MKGRTRDVELTERQLRALARDAVLAAASVVLYAPLAHKPTHAAAQRILRTFGVLGKNASRP